MKNYIFILFIGVVACGDDPQPVYGVRCDSMHTETIGCVCNNGMVTYELDGACGSRSQGGIAYYLCKP